MGARRRMARGQGRGARPAHRRLPAARPGRARDVPRRRARRSSLAADEQRRARRRSARRAAHRRAHAARAGPREAELVIRTERAPRPDAPRARARSSPTAARRDRRRPRCTPRAARASAAAGVVVFDGEQGPRAPRARRASSPRPPAPNCSRWRRIDRIDACTPPTTVGSAEPKRRKPRDRPLLIVVTGHGKGKSTSAFGMLLRAWARGYRCGVFQFVKSGKWKVGEAKAAQRAGRDRLGEDGRRLDVDQPRPRGVRRQGARGLGGGQAADRRRALRVPAARRAHLRDQVRLDRRGGDRRRRCATARASSTSSSPAATPRPG